MCKNIFKIYIVNNLQCFGTILIMSGLSICQLLVSVVWCYASNQQVGSYAFVIVTPWRCHVGAETGRNLMCYVTYILSRSEFVGK
jgi:hypothetical protein